ncbi:MAG: NUDIX hydrolase [Ancalomicrobiaceae bacterium]|nr:NUDIX hydrolase [Ancalomicrobiaceae bacterium]
MPEPVVLKSLELTIRAEPHRFPADERAAIDAHWQRLVEANPRLWNGSAFLFNTWEISGDGAFSARGAATDYAAFLYWRALPASERRHYHLFPVGAILTRDERLLVGRMSAHTANAGRHYPPSGSFDASDLIQLPDDSARLDVEGNMYREIFEELGLPADRLSAEPSWLFMASSPNAHALVRVMSVAETSDELAPALRQYIANDPHQELEDIRFIDYGTRFAPEASVPYVNDLLAYLAARG